MQTVAHTKHSAYDVGAGTRAKISVVSTLPAEAAGAAPPTVSAKDRPRMVTGHRAADDVHPPG